MALQGSVFPVLPPVEVQHAISLIQRLYSPGLDGETQKQLSDSLVSIQKTPEAWGLIIPLVQHPDPSVQFVGAQIAQVKIARDWETFPADQAIALKDTLLDLTGRSCSNGTSRVAVRKLFVAVIGLALRIAPLRNTEWPDWVLESVTALSGRGASAEQVLEFLGMTAEEAQRTDFLGAVKHTFNQSLTDSVSMMLEAVQKSCTNPNASESEKESALKCLQRWVEWGIPADDLTKSVPLLISLLSSRDTFIAASDVLQEILTTSALSDGRGTKTLTEPLLAWIEASGQAILNESIEAGMPDEKTHSLCKLLIAIGEHSSVWLADHLGETRVTNFLNLVLSFTNYPGVYLIDEEESEVALPFWYLFQESLMESPHVAYPESPEWEMAKSLYTQLVIVLRKKAAWPTEHLMKDQVERYRNYRRDVGDALMNAYYILREPMMGGLIDLLYQQLQQPEGLGYWQDVEATLHVIKSIQEAVSVEEQEHLPRLWSQDLLNRISSSPDPRVRQTMLGVISTYSSWFPSKDPSTIMTATLYVLNSLNMSSVSLQAANALRELCDNNRTVLAQNSLSWFADLYGKLDTIPEDEKEKVLQSITSVIQALPVEQAVEPATQVVSPLAIKLSEALSVASQFPEEARLVCIDQLRWIAACAKGFTYSHDFLSDLINPSDEDEVERRQRMHTVRQDARLQQLRANIQDGIRGCFSLWSMSADMATALSELLRAITGLPSEETLISLEPEPLLTLVCGAAERQLTATWLSLAQILITQLDPKKFLWIRPSADPESLALVREATLSLLNTAVQVLGQPGAMEANTDLVQDFFGSCMNAIAMHFITEMYKLPPEALNSLIQAAISAMSLPERYCIVSGVRFLHTFIDQTLRECPDNAIPLNKMHGFAMLHVILHGIAFRAPRSTIPNLSDLLAILSSKFFEDTQVSIRTILFSDDFSYPKATPAAKDAFMKAVARHRRVKKVKEAANDFALVVRGLEASGFGYASSSA
ncbi:ARM repeat-containing protein [Calocera viscosa TUFC12733]|uniref:ARM repeat-containing protein n=1 Tax=Calocera viscosa (strain TUFC12733) TaxID=1330018 RepID=A0A167HI05_CALVF|nr:ARM repeat-containing protein [Calocera viscosa TUFC12733]